MGGDLTRAPKGEAPRFLVYAIKDPRGANLDRIQIVKGWLGADSTAQEKVYDVAWSGERKRDANGSLERVGNTVDLGTGIYEHDIGEPQLATVWEDPDFDPNVRAFYYVRVLQIPTPRHALYDAVALGMDPQETGHPPTIQKRAHSSPIWYTPYMEPLPRFFPVERAVALSDGVFAIVITILVFGIEVPSDVVLDATAIALRREKLLYQLLIYGVTFCLVAMYWSQHGILFDRLRLMDRRMVGLNLLFLLPVTLLPFVTQLMGSIGYDWRVVLVFVAINMFAALVTELQLALVVARPETHKDESTPRLAQRMRWGTRFFAAVLTTGVLVSLLDVKAGILIILLMPFIYFLNFFRDPLGSRARPQSQDRGD